MIRFFTLLTMILLLTGVSMEGYGQVDPNKPDLRDGSCTICKGNAQNYSILNVYFSDAAGNPNDICEGSGPYYISLLYTSNARNDIHNFRLIADIVKKDRNDPDGDALASFYINEFSGSISPCNTGSCIVTIPIPDIGIECKNEFYELSNPLVSWTTSGNKDLEDSYNCQSYPAAQCLNNTTSIPIEVGTLAYSFEPIFECFAEDLTQTNVSFIITSLFGGNPTLEYDATWNFTFPDGSTLSSTDFNPTVWNRAVGSEVIASLTITQGNLVGKIESYITAVPDALSTDDVILSESVNESTIDGQTGIDLATGSIEVTFEPGDYFYYWTSLDDPTFYSEEALIDSLVGGTTYSLTTIDNATGRCRVDLFDLGAKILPVELADFNVQFLNQTRSAKITWSTTKEWESSHFEIERAVKGVEFVKIGEVNAAGWSDVMMQYSFEDTALPLGESNVLYRLKQVDLTGHHHYSKVLAVKTPGAQFTSGVWRAYPNPTLDNQLRISLLDRTQYDEEPITFRLVHPTAQSQAVAVKTEMEMNEQLSQMVARIPKGVFVVEIQWGKKIEHIKVLKQ